MRKTVKEQPKNREKCLTVHIGKYTKMSFNQHGKLDQIKLTGNKFMENEKNGVFDQGSVFDYEELELIALTGHMRIVEIDQDRTKKQLWETRNYKMDGFVFYLKPNDLTTNDFRSFMG